MSGVFPWISSRLEEARSAKDLWLSAQPSPRMLWGTSRRHGWQAYQKFRGPELERWTQRPRSECVFRVWRFGTVSLNQEGQQEDLKPPLYILEAQILRDYPMIKLTWTEDRCEGLCHISQPWAALWSMKFVKTGLQSAGLHPQSWWPGRSGVQTENLVLKQVHRCHWGFRNRCLGNDCAGGIVLLRSREAIVLLSCAEEL